LEDEQGNKKANPHTIRLHHYCIVGERKMAFHPWKMSIDGRLWAFYLHGLLSYSQTLERPLFFSHKNI
jgi:hypothetical protein